MKDHTFEIPRRDYLEFIQELQRMTPEILKLFSDDETAFIIERWETDMKSEMHRNLKEGDMAPNTTETNQAVLSQPEAQDFTTVSITRWNPNSIANMSAAIEWSVNGGRIFYSLHYEADGEAHKACVIGPHEAHGYPKFQQKLLHKSSPRPVN